MARRVYPRLFLFLHLERLLVFDAMNLPEKRTQTTFGLARIALNLTNTQHPRNLQSLAGDWRSIGERFLL